MSVAKVGTGHGLSRRLPRRENGPHCPGPHAQHPSGPQLTEYKENADGEQDHSKHQPPDPQALVIWGEETQGLVPATLREGGSLFSSPSPMYMCPSQHTHPRAQQCSP